MSSPFARNLVCLLPFDRFIQVILVSLRELSTTTSWDGVEPVGESPAGSLLDEAIPFVLLLLLTGYVISGRGPSGGRRGAQ